MDNPSQEKIISDSESQSLGSQDSWSTEDSSQSSLSPFIIYESDSQSSYITGDTDNEEDFWRGVDKYQKNKQ